MRGARLPRVVLPRLLAGVRRWRDKHDGEEIEVLEVTETSGVPCVRIRTPSGEYGYTMRSSINWDPIPNA